MCKVLVDSRWIGKHGIGRFSREVIDEIKDKCLMPARFDKLSLIDPLWIYLVINRIKPDVYFTPGFNPPIISKVPYIITLHDLNHIDVPESSGLFKKLYYHLLIKRACKMAFKVLTVSEFSKKRIMEWAGVEESKVVNVGNGVGPEFCVEGAKKKLEEDYFFYVGNKKPHKNIKRLLRSFSLFIKSNPYTMINLVMSGEPGEIELIEELGIKNRVVFAGMIEDEILPEYYRGAVALVMPSLYEGFGLPVIEAMACGTFVIASNAASLPEVAGDSALLVDPYNIEQMSEAMRVALEDKDLRKELIEKGLKNAERFSWENTSRKILQIIHSASSANTNQEKLS